MNPVILWYSDPVRPDETVVIEGEDFCADAVVELSAILESGAESAQEWEQITPLQSSGQSLKAVIPAGYAPGLYRCRVRQKQAVSNEVILNAPDQDRSLTQEDVATLLHTSPESVSCIPLSRGQIVRRHLIDNNSSIRIRGAGVDVLVEKCVIKDSQRGIRVDSQPQKKHTEDLDMLYFEPEPETPAPGQAQPFLSPKGVLLRKNEMHRVGVPYSGTALEFACVEKD